MPDNTPQPKAGQWTKGQSKVDQTSPSPNDRILSDFIESNAADYLNLLAGYPHPDFEQFPDMRLVKQVPINWQLVSRIYANDQQPIEDTYNASISYSGEGAAYPIFTRDYIVRRSEYARLANGSTLTGVVNVKVTAGGTGYSQDTVSVSASEGSGSGFAATAIVSNGIVIDIGITNEGSGYTAAPTITISGGTGATATAYIQPATAILVKEDFVRQPDQSTDSLYVLVRRIYETLPGPSLAGQEWDKKLGLTRPFVKRIDPAGAHIGDSATQIEPISSAKQETTVWGDAAFQSELDAYLLVTPVSIRGLRLPDVLKSLTAIYNYSTGAGESETDPTGAATGTSISLSLNDHSHSQGTASVIPELIIERAVWAEENEPPGVRCNIFAPDNSTRSEVVSHLSSLLGRNAISIVAGVVTTAPAADGTVPHKLAINQIFKFSTVVGGSGGIAANTSYYVKAIPSPTTFTYSATSGGSALTGQAATSAVTIIPINEMPLWQKAPVTIIGTGQSVSVAADASAQQSISLSSSELAYVRTNGSGKSHEVSLSVRSWQIPPTIHASVTVDVSSSPGTLTASAAAAATTDITDATNWPNGNGASATVEEDAVATITPSSTGGTTQITWPFVGLYIVRWNDEQFESDRTLYSIYLLDFATIPPP